jgi:AraC-like DNA-binding protein
MNRACEGMRHRKSPPFAILLQVLEGHYEIQCAGRAFKLYPGQTAFIPANTPVEFVHRAGPSGYLRAQWLHFYYSCLGVIDFLSLLNLPLLLPESLSGKLDHLLTMARGKDEAGPGSLAADIRRYQVAASVLDALAAVSAVHKNRLFSARLQRVLPALLHIDKALSSPFGVKHLARLCGLSESRFHAVFSQEFACSPMHYVRRKRLERAARLLVSGNDKLAAVAGDTGFADAFHLSHAFKRHYGLSPLLYRRQARALWK